MKYDEINLRLCILQILNLFPVPHQYFTTSESCRFISVLLSSGYKEYLSKFTAMLEIMVVHYASWMTPKYLAWDII